MIPRSGAAIVLLLGGCATTAVQPPPQPTPSRIEATIVELSKITGDPVAAWRAGVYAVRFACHTYLNRAAMRSADLSVANTGLGLTGASAAGFLAAGGNPAGAALATGLASLGQSFLSAYQASGPIPYTGATTTLIEQALAAEEATVEARLPMSIAQAASYVDDLWWYCSPGGYAQLVLKSAVTAQVTSGPATPSFAAPPAASPPPGVRRNAAPPRRAAASSATPDAVLRQEWEAVQRLGRAEMERRRPQIFVNGH